MASAFQSSRMNVRIGIVLATVALASACAASSSSSPHSLQQVRTAGPSVTYDYSGDEALLQAAQNAATFCRQYNSTPGPPESRTIRMAAPTAWSSNASEPAAGRGPAAGGRPNLTYSYRTDEELLAASRTAEAYCANDGSHGVVSNITPNTDGSKTVTFKCVRG